MSVDESSPELPREPDRVNPGPYRPDEPILPPPPPPPINVNPGPYRPEEEIVPAGELEPDKPILEKRTNVTRVTPPKPQPPPPKLPDSRPFRTNVGRVPPEPPSIKPKPDEAE